MPDVTRPRAISFGDNVRVLSTPATVGRRLAGLIGQVYGETTPSLTKVEVIGETTEDYAINVFFKERGEALWLTEELLELVDHAPGTEIRLKGVQRKWVRASDGQWTEESTERQNKPAVTPKGPTARTRRPVRTSISRCLRPWWRFWRLLW